MQLPDVSLDADIMVPAQARGLVIFAHGAGSSRHSSRNRLVASSLQERGFGTMLFDLLTETEDLNYATRFDIALLTERLLNATAWIQQRQGFTELPLGYFGASTGAAAALNAAAALGNAVAAVVSRGGRPDLAMDQLSRVHSPTLLIVGGADGEVLELNKLAYGRLAATRKQLAVVAGATHLFEEPGALDEVARLAGQWFERHCATPADAAASA
jgi:alpha-beta hydrolase superfamily lysophospholipase